MATYGSIEEIEYDGDRLRASAVRILMERIQQGRPIVLRRVCDGEMSEVSLCSWTNHVRRAGRDRFTTYCHGPCTLHHIWNSDVGIRLETGVRNDERNPVREWLASSVSSSDLLGLWRIQQQLDSIASRLQPVEVRHPAFVTGAIQAGGGPTHYDDYENFALMVCGSKTFYLAEPAALQHLPIRGQRSNERLGVNPFNRASLAPGSSSAHLDEVPFGTWLTSTLNSGDMLYLPARYWHWVYSEPHTIMTNV